ncbi:MAG: hypothetical protein JW982_08190 [Spirochaetes bacterium]|nr:hypothetical protein [Spirochaetota bacterium]
MKKYYIRIILILSVVVLSIKISLIAENKVKTCHILIPLCDNLNQGIVKVNSSLGNGQNPATNLYWGAYYGFYSYIKRNSGNWKIIANIKNPEVYILNRLILKHKTKNFYICADAYDGSYINICVNDFLSYLSGKKKLEIQNRTDLFFGKESDLIIYSGHNGLMDFTPETRFIFDNEKRKAVILACYSKNYFMPYLKNTKIEPMVWTNGLLAPEGYLLKAVLDGWALNENAVVIWKKVSEAYSKYQNISIKSSNRIFTTGY